MLGSNTLALRTWLTESSHYHMWMVPMASIWTWEFAVDTNAGRLWLGRFVVIVWPHWGMRDRLRSRVEVDLSVEE